MISRPLFQKRPLGFLLLGLSGLALQLVPGCGRGLMDGSGQVITSAPVSPQGGEVRLGQASLRAPAGALTSTTEITVERQQASDPAPLGDVYQFGPEGLTFATPVTMQLPSSADAKAGIGLWSSDEWEAVSGSHYDAQAGVVVGNVMHFSRYAALRFCSSNADCRSGHECRRGVCQLPRSQDAAVADAATGGNDGGNAGQGGNTGSTGGSGGMTSSGGSGGTGGNGTGGRGTGGGAGFAGTGGAGGAGGMGGAAGKGGTAGTGAGGFGGKAGAGGMGATGGKGGAGGSGGAGSCPATQPPVVDATCPNPPATCDYGSTRCICAVGRVWSCGLVTGGAGGSGGAGGNGGTGGSSGSCIAGGQSVTCKSTGVACNAHTECATKLCSNSSGTTCPSGATCTCTTKSIGTACNAPTECVTNYCSGIAAGGSGCATDAVCSCAAKPCLSNSECPDNASCLTSSNAACTTGATCVCKLL